MLRAYSPVEASSATGALGSAARPSIRAAAVVPLSTQHIPILRRNLVHTAVTWDKRPVVLVGQSQALAVEMGRTTAAGFGRSAIDENNPHTAYTYNEVFGTRIYELRQICLPDPPTVMDVGRPCRAASISGGHGRALQRSRL
jgi:hypothetical protein